MSKSKKRHARSKKNKSNLDIRAGKHARMRESTQVGFSGDSRNMARLGKSGSTKLGALVSDIPHHHVRPTGEVYMGKDGREHRKMEKYCPHYERLYDSLANVTRRLCPYPNNDMPLKKTGVLSLAG